MKQTISGVLKIGVMVLAPSIAQAVPTVDGLVFGDDSVTGGDGTPDIEEYILYDTSEFGSNLYIYLDVPNKTLYAALVVGRDVNDNVFGRQKQGFGNTNKPYANSAGWDSIRSADNLINSEFAEFTFECAKGSETNAWGWQQGYACEVDENGNPTSGTGVWASTEVNGCAGGAPSAPPGLTSASSFMYNMNRHNYTTNAAAYPWNLFIDGGSLVQHFHSPFDKDHPLGRDTVDFDGSYPAEPSSEQPGFSDQMNYEWSMIYEWSVDLGPNGAQCGNNNIFLVTGSSHHSPSKIEGVEDDTFTGEDPPILSDWGDLPDRYGTTADNNGARHYATAEGPYLGADIQVEDNGNPTEDASGDGSEEDGITVNVTENWIPGSTQTFEAEVNNAPDGARLGVWFDWNNDGDFEDLNEFYAFDVSDGTNTLEITVGDGFEWSSDDLYARFRIFSSDSASPSGNLSVSDSTGTATDGEIEDYHYEAGSLPVSLNAFSSRFAGNNLKVEWQTASETNNVGFELWGETFDGEWIVLSDFVASKSMSSALPQTYKESVTVGADIVQLALVDYDTRGRPERFGPFEPGKEYGEIQPVERIDWEGPRLNRQARLANRGFVNTSPSRADRSAKRKQSSDQGRHGSEKRFDSRADHRSANAVVADFSRSERFRKLAQSGQSNGRGPNSDGRGRNSDPIVVDVPSRTPESSNEPQDQQDQSIVLHTGPMTHVAVTEPGIQRVSYERLREAGLDLAGRRHNEIAVTARGEPVARWIEGRGNRFGPGHWIEFIGQPPQGDDALYIDSNLYQISVDASKAREARRIGKGKARNVSDSYQEAVVMDRPLIYRDQSPTGDPWLERAELVRSSKTINLEIPVEGPVMPGGQASVIVGLGTITDLPDIVDGDGNVIPEHNVDIELRGPGPNADPVSITSSSVSGQTDWEIQADLPAGFLKPGTYELVLRFHTEYFFSSVVVDHYGFEYAAHYEGPRLDFAPDSGAAGYRIENAGSTALSAYAEAADGSLTRIEPWFEDIGDGIVAELRQVSAERIWVDGDPHAPDVFTTEAPGDLVSASGDLIIVAESSLVGTPALEDYVKDKSAYNPVVVDVEDIYNSAGYGMALPSAITNFLNARDEVSPFTHVQLVGTDCYDRLNYISDCVSFIPLPTARVGFTFYSPSQNKLVDLDGDGIGDKPVAQFSVRDESELEMIVQKGRSWRANVAGSQSALLVADKPDGKNDFLSQIQRLEERLDWPGAEILSLTDHAPGAAREAFKSSLDDGRALTIYSGHSGPQVWSHSLLLTYVSAKQLSNQGRPTLMVPLACQATYDISPNANVLGHQLMYAGDRGALAISGAVSLSSLKDNERMANHIVDGLKSGQTLGESVQSARDELGEAFRMLHDNWITQGDVTARMEQQ